MIIAKTILDEKQTKAKLKISKILELQLLGDFLEITEEEENKYINKFGNNIKVVHSPLWDEPFSIKHLNSEKGIKMFYKTIGLAKKIANFSKNKIIVVIHFNELFSEILRDDYLMRELEFFILNIVQFNNIEIAFENVLPIVDNNYLDNFNFRNNSLFEGVKLAKYLNDKYETNIFGTVLDTCHAIATINFFNVVNPYINNPKQLTLDDFFRTNKEVIKLIHLSKGIEFTLKKNQHGLKFDTKEEMLDVLESYFKYNYEAPITLELIEHDYIKNINLKNNYLIINEIFQEQDNFFLKNKIS